MTLIITLIIFIVLRLQGKNVVIMDLYYDIKSKVSLIKNTSKKITP